MLSIKYVLFAGFIAGITIVVGGQPLFAQTEGLLQPVAGAMEESLPAGAVYENGIVRHPISSSEENLHLLAGFYYRNPREWKRIYQNNRHIIKNPNRLPVGETLKVEVGENWKPLFSYDEWFRLANRNGQWQPKRSRPKTSGTSKKSSPVPQKTPQAETPSQPKPSASEPKAAEPQPTPAQQPPAPVDRADQAEEPPEEEEDVAPAF